MLGSVDALEYQSNDIEVLKKEHADQLAKLTKEQSQALEAAKTQIISIHKRSLAIEADKRALIQTLNEATQTVVNLRSKIIQDETIAKNNIQAKDAQIADLTKRLADASK